MKFEDIKQTVIDHEYTALMNDPDYVISFVEWAYGHLSEDQIRAEYDELVAAELIKEGERNA